MDDVRRPRILLGNLGTAPATPGMLGAFLSLVPEGWTWSVAGIGRYQLDANMMAVAAGGHVRVGLEDNIYLSKGVLAKSNAELVAKARRILEDLGGSIASPDESRAILGLRAA